MTQARPTTDSPEHAPVLVIGGGASGTLVALHLARLGRRAVLVDRANAFARGVAYDTDEPAHLLNVPTGRMSAFPDRPADFLDWLRARAPDASADGFARRADYGAYLTARLLDAGAAVERVIAEVVTLEPTPTGVCARLSDGAMCEGRAAVLALGNLAPELPPGWDALPSGRAWRSPWGRAHAWPEPDGDVLLLGAGLTAVDVALSLDARGHRGRIHVLSRHGAFPRTHPEVPLAPVSPPVWPTALRTLFREVRVLSRTHDPRAVLDGLRSLGPAPWLALDDGERARFVRHARSAYEVLRHRLAPAVGARMDALAHDGRLVRHAGRLLEVRATAEGLDVRFRRRGTREVARLAVAVAVPCTGPAQRLTSSGDPLVRSLLGTGQARPGPLGLGVATTPDGAVHGALEDRLFTLGALRRGELWETTAIPEIRLQAEALARRLAA